MIKYLISKRIFLQFIVDIRVLCWVYFIENISLRHLYINICNIISAVKNTLFTMTDITHSDVQKKKNTNTDNNMIQNIISIQLIFTTYNTKPSHVFLCKSGIIYLIYDANR